MAYNSKCPKCESSSFEVEYETPKNSNFKLLFVCCSSCGTVVGVLDYYNIGAMLEKLGDRLNINLRSS